MKYLRQDSFHSLIQSLNKFSSLRIINFILHYITLHKYVAVGCCRLGGVLTTAGNIFAACTSVERVLTLMTRGSAAL